MIILVSSDDVENCPEKLLLKRRRAETEFDYDVLAARLGDACNVPPAYVEQARSAMAGKPVTVLDIPVLGTDREHAASIVERVRGRSSAATFARTRGAGTAPDLIARYERMAEQGVSTVFVAPADFTGPDDLDRWRPVLDAFAAR